jgi:hypothetical protein
MLPARGLKIYNQLLRAQVLRVKYGHIDQHFSAIHRFNFSLLGFRGCGSQSRASSAKPTPKSN